MANPIINGIAYGYSSVRISMLGNSSVVGVKAIDFKKTQPKEPVHGAGSQIIGMGLGNIACEGSLTLLQEELNALRGVAPNGDILQIPPFDILVAIAQTPTGAATVITLKGCAFKEDGLSSSSGDTEMSMQIPLFITDILYGT